MYFTMLYYICQLLYIYIMITRRKNLQSLMMMPFFWPLLNSHASNKSNELSLWLRRSATGEELKATYSINSKLQIDGFIAICNIMRDINAPLKYQVVRMDIKLLNLLFAVQQKVNLISREPLIITSAYRHPRSNMHTEGAAKNSQHTLGRACDFYVAGLTAMQLGRIVAAFREGGVGLYASRNFVHADTGRVRFWNQ